MKITVKPSLRALLVLLLTLAITVCLSSCLDNHTEDKFLYDKDALLESIEESGDYTANHVYSYFAAWRFPKFDKSKLDSVENTFRKNYVEPLPTAGELAHDMADCFFEYYYGEIDLHDSEELTIALVNCLILSIGDDYAIYRTPEEFEDYDTDMSGEVVGIGVQIMFNRLENTCLVESVHSDSGAEKAGILAGDYIIAVDGKLVSEMGYEKTLSSVRGDVGTTVKITVLRAGAEISFDIVRSVITEQTISYNVSDDKIGYVKITGFKENTADQFKAAIHHFESEGCVGVIYDLRSNPGGYLSSVLEMISYVAPKGRELVSFSNDYGDPIICKDPHTYLVPSVVICDRYTASAAELFTSAIRDFGAAGYLEVTLVGETTYGKGVMQSTFFYSDGSTVTLTVAYYNPPSGNNYHKDGIIPGVVCENMELALDVAYQEINKLVK